MSKVKKGMVLQDGSKIYDHFLQHLTTIAETLSKIENPEQRIEAYKLFQSELYDLDDLLRSFRVGLVIEIDRENKALQQIKKEVDELRRNPTDSTVSKSK